MADDKHLEAAHNAVDLSCRATSDLGRLPFSKEVTKDDNDDASAASEQSDHHHRDSNKSDLAKRCGRQGDRPWNKDSKDASQDQKSKEEEACSSNDFENARPTESNQPPVHSAFSKSKKRFIVTMAAIAGFFSPFSASIYFPALNSIAAELRQPKSLINLTLTSYMIFQGLAPTFFGGLADAAGRRPAYIICFVIYMGACIGIALQDNFAALFILRCLQSSGSSGTIALASGVAADIATSAERGTYMGWVTSGAMVGPAIGPVLGGIFAQFLGWRWIFWFLLILGGAFMIPLVIAFPETARQVVGDGSIPPQGWNMSLLNYLEVRKKRKQHQTDNLSRTTSTASLHSQRRPKARVRFPNPLSTLKLLLEKDVAILLLYNALIYTAFYDVMSSVPYLFAQTYRFNDLQIGLSFIPFGIGSLLAPVTNGRLLDWNFRRVARRNNIPFDKSRATSLKDFPLEQARIPIAIPLILVGDAALLCYGWVMDVEAPLAAPLVLLFIIGLSITGAFNVMSVILVDYYPMSPSSATACNNLVRCLMGAAGTAVIIQMIDGMGRGWCFTFIAAVVFLASAALPVLLRWGPGWREARRVKVEEREKEKGREGG